MAEISDEELASLQALKDKQAQTESELAKLREENQQGTMRYQQMVDQYNRDLGAVTAYAQSLQKPNEPESEEVVERRKLKDELTQGILQGINPVAMEMFKSQRSNSKELARQDPELRRFLDDPKYGKEIETMLDSQPPNVVTTVEAYKMAVNAVRGLHFNDLVNETVEERMRPPKRTRGSDEEEEEEEEEPETPARRTVGAPMPASTRALGSAPKTPRRKFKPLDDTEQTFARRFGLQDEEYDQFSHDLTVDIMGFKGRARV